MAITTTTVVYTTVSSPIMTTAIITNTSGQFNQQDDRVFQTIELQEQQLQENQQHQRYLQYQETETGNLSPNVQLTSIPVKQSQNRDRAIPSTSAVSPPAVNEIPQTQAKGGTQSLTSSPSSVSHYPEAFQDDSMGESEIEEDIWQEPNKRSTFKRRSSPCEDESLAKKATNINNTENRYRLLDDDFQNNLHETFMLSKKLELDNKEAQLKITSSSNNDLASGSINNLENIEYIEKSNGNLKTNESLKSKVVTTKKNISSTSDSNSSDNNSKFTQKSNSSNSNLNNPSDNSPGPLPEKNPWLPPIIIKSEFWATIHKGLRTKQIDFKTKISGEKIKIFFKKFDRNVRNAVFEDCKKYGFEAYTFTPKDEKPVIVLLKGVHRTHEVSEISSEFKQEFPEIGLIEVSHLVTPMTKRKSTADYKFKIDIFRLVLEPDTNTSELMKTRYFMNYAVRWEKPTSKGPVQCRTCQSFGHLAMNCLLKYRCVKCGDKHGPSECKKSKEDTPYCINCGQVGHPASYRGCLFYKKYLSNLQANTRNKVMKISNREFIPQPLNPVTPNLSFAQASKGNFPQLSNRNRESIPAHNQILGFDSQKQVQTQSIPKQQMSDDFRTTQTIRQPPGFSSQIDNSNNPIQGFIDMADELFGRSHDEVIDLIVDFMNRTVNMSNLQKRREYVKISAILYGIQRV